MDEPNNKPKTATEIEAQYARSPMADLIEAVASASFEPLYTNLMACLNEEGKQKMAEALEDSNRIQAWLNGESECPCCECHTAASLLTSLPVPAYTVINGIYIRLDGFDLVPFTRVNEASRFSPAFKRYYNNQGALSRLIAIAAKEKGWPAPVSLKQRYRLSLNVWRKNDLGDYSNYEKALEDAIERAGLFMNDKQRKLTGEGGFYPGHKPCIEFLLEEIEFV